MTDVKLKPNEVIEPLDGEHIIIQPKVGYRFGSDAIALSKYAAEFTDSDSAVFELCSGCGVIGITIAIERGCGVDGAEIDGELCDMSNRAAAANGLDNVRFFNADVRDMSGFKSAAYDVVLCNPPYYRKDSKPSSVAPNANSELTVTLDYVVKAAAKLLKVGGAFAMVYTSTRMDEALGACHENKLMPKQLTVLGDGKTFLLKAVRGAKHGMQVTVKK